MTVVHPNHIVGINSITVQTGDSLSVHKADGSLIRTIVSNTGVSTFHAVEVSKGGGDLNVGVSTFFVDNSAGKVGIGTDIPGQTLHLSAVSGDVYNRVDTNVNGGMLIYVQGTQRSVIANDSAFSGTITDTGIGAKGNLIFRAGTSSYDERLRILSNGRIGINTSEATSTLQIYAEDLGEGTAKGQIVLKDTAAYNASPQSGIVFQGHHASNNAQAIFSGIRGLKANAADGDYDGCLAFDVRKHGDVAYEAMRIDEDGRLLIGTAANQHNSGDLLQLAAESSTASLGLNRFTANAHPSYINFFKSRNASLSGQTVVQDGDNLGQITWAGSDGTNRAYAAFLDAEVDGTPGDGDMPGRLTFSTSADGSESPTERLRIDKDGRLLIGSQRSYSGQGYYDDITINNSNTADGAAGSTGINLISGNNTWSAILFGDSDDDDVGSIKYSHIGNYLRFTTAGATRMELNSDGDMIPEVDGSQDLGSSSKRWQDVYTSDLDLSNETKGGNTIDGTWGSYKIEEGENDLFLINRRNNKRYKFNLTEVD